MKKNLFKNVEKSFKKNSPAILTGVTVGSIFGVGILSFKAGVKSADTIKENKERYKKAKRRGDKSKQREIIFSTAAEVGKNSIPTFVVGATGTASAIASNYISNKRIALLSAGLVAAERVIKENEEAVEQVFGESGAEKVRAEKARKRYEEDPTPYTPDQLDQYFNEYQKYPCKIGYDNTNFFSNAVEIKQAILVVKDRLLSGEEFVSLNDFKEELGLPQTRAGDNVGWNQMDCIASYNPSACQVPIYLESILGPGDRPVLSIEMDIFYRHDLRELM